MAPSTDSTAPSAALLLQQVSHIISRLKGIARRRLRATTDLLCECGLEMLDIVDIILEVESYFMLTIPDEVPLRTPGDFVHYQHQQLPLVPTQPALRPKRRARQR